jgi:hypothetical protein
MPISATESSRPKMRTKGCTRGAPAMASTLSRDIETSAATIGGTRLGPASRPDLQIFKHTLKMRPATLRRRSCHPRW